ncbi:MAG: flagellar export chaperone FliS [Treponema sp.]|nr:flagellar export chaperone FliS [Treponema sp.]MBR4464877.1 flagellar export chaperone FliS [Treponema sp.]
MAFTNPYAAYQNTAVKTASQGKLVVMLYETAVKQLAAAIKCFDEKTGKVPANTIETYSNHIMKTQEIINELQVSLDMDKGGQIAQNLMSLYVYFNRELMDANINKDKEKLTFVQNMMAQLLDAWESASNSAANAPAANVRPTLNIRG